VACFGVCATRDLSVFVQVVGGGGW